MSNYDLTDDAPQVMSPEDNASAVMEVYEDGQSVETSYQPQQDFVSGIERSTQEAGDSGEDFRHKYEVLKGKYDKEVPRLHKEIKQLKREKEDLLKRLSLLESVVANMQQAQVQAQPQARAEDLGDDELKKFAEDYPEVYKAMMKLVEKKVGSVERKVQETSQQSAVQRFYAQLTALVPNWEQLNEDPDFLDWLQEPEGDTGFTRHQLMLMAYQQGDANRVARFFQRFISGNGNSQQANPYKGKAQANTYPPARKPATTDVSGKKFFKESEVKEFYRLSALGKIPPDRKASLEREILEALAENRIIYGQ